MGFPILLWEGGQLQTTTTKTTYQVLGFSRNKLGLVIMQLSFGMVDREKLQFNRKEIKKEIKKAGYGRLQIPFRIHYPYMGDVYL